MNFSIQAPPEIMYDPMKKIMIIADNTSLAQKIRSSMPERHTVVVDMSHERPYRDHSFNIVIHVKEDKGVFKAEVIKSSCESLRKGEFRSYEDAISFIGDVCKYRIDTLQAMKLDADRIKLNILRYLSRR